MAKKKKKKKKPSGARKPTYAKGKPVAADDRKDTTRSTKQAASRPGSKTAPATKAGAKEQAAGDEKKEPQQWNLVRRGSLEAKVMWALFAIIALAALARYPLTAAEADAQYSAASKQYKEQLKEFEEKHETEKEQKKHEKDKPVKPAKPSSNVVLISVVFGALQAAIFAFLGVNIIRRTDLETPVLDKALSGGRLGWPDIRPFLTWSLPAAALMLGPLYVNAMISENLISSVFKASETTEVKFPAWKQLLGSFNDSLFFLVLFVMVAVPSFTWLVLRDRDRLKVEPHWAGLGAAFLLSFGFILLNVSSSTRSAGESIAGSTQALYALALAAPVLLLGYVFWKKGLEYSLLAGMLGFALYPIMASLVI